MAGKRVPLFARESSLTPIKAEILRRVGGIIDSGTYIQGEDVAAFEQEFASYLGCKHCVGVANGHVDTHHKYGRAGDYCLNHRDNPSSSLRQSGTYE